MFGGMFTPLLSHPVNTHKTAPKKSQSNVQNMQLGTIQAMCVRVFVSYHMTKIRERTVVSMKMENKTKRITRPKLPSSPCTTPAWEGRGGKKEEETVSRTHQVGYAEQQKVDENRGVCEGGKLGT